MKFVKIIRTKGKKLTLENISPKEAIPILKVDSKLQKNPFFRLIFRLSRLISGIDSIYFFKS